MLTIKIGLMDTTGTVDAKVMAAVAAALNVQVTRDLPQFWPIRATVAYLPGKRAVPQGVWPVKLVATLPPDEGGFHLTNSHKQPYAKVITTPGSNEWTIDASHEILEMLIDPGGNRLQTSAAIGIDGGGKIVPAKGVFEYLVEACDPCEADDYSYTIDGISVSDFITPHFYDPHPVEGVRYSFTGALKAPRQILPGGYISWVNPTTHHMQQLLYLDGPPVIKDLGKMSGSSLREFVEAKTHSSYRTKRKMSQELRTSREEARAEREAIAEVRGELYT